MRSAPVLAVVKILTTSRHSGSQAIDRVVLCGNSANSSGIGLSAVVGAAMGPGYESSR
jgi:uncharacterized membrane protein YgaE (UPF0421/DUF939 family)